jgi:hypothetical protein
VAGDDERCSVGTVSRNTWALILSAAVVAAVFAAFVVAVRSIVPALPEPLEDLAASDARDRAQSLENHLTSVVNTRGDASRPELTAAVEEAFASSIPVGGYEPIGAGEAESVWRAQVSGSAQRGGMFGSWAAAVLCVDVTIDPEADPPVRMVDSECLSEPRTDDRLVSLDPPR